MNYLVEAIKLLKPEAEFSFIDDDYSTINWDVLEGNPPTDSEIKSAIDEIKARELSAEQTKTEAKAALLERLGITAEEAALLLG